MSHHRCNKLHLTITIKDCEAIRNRPLWGGRAGGPSRPPQCSDCEDWKAWTEENGLERERFDTPKPPEKEEAAPITAEDQMPSMKKGKGICEGCGEEKTLLSKTLCHQCVKNKQKEGEPKKVGREAVKVALDFSQDVDLLHELAASAHLNYRTLSNEIISTLRLSFGETIRPKSEAKV